MLIELDDEILVKRNLYLDKIKRLINKDIIKIITGVRRCGKSHMLKLIINELLERGITESNILLINLEDSKYRYIKNDQELDDFILDYASGIDGKLYILLDEIQNVEGWEKAINGYRVSLNCDIYITGSNSKLLSGEYATVLTGRYMEIKIYPFSFNEFLSYKLSELDDNIDDNLIQLYERQVFDEYIMYGGIPFLTKIDNTDDKLDYLEDIFNSILYKDLIQRYKIGNVDLLNRLIQYMMDNTGNLFSAGYVENLSFLLIL